MKALPLLLLVLLCGCSTLNQYGIGGAPVLACVHGAAAIDDRIAGSDGVHLSLVRSFVDGDVLCAWPAVRTTQEGGRLDR